MRSHTAMYQPVAQRTFWGLFVACGITLAATACRHSDVPANSADNSFDESPGDREDSKWSGTASPAPPPGPSSAAQSEPESKAGKFDEEQAKVVLARAAKNAHTCVDVTGKDQPKGNATVTVTFSGVGRSTKAAVGGEFENSQIGQCVTRAFVGIIIPPFQGSDVQMTYPVDLMPEPKGAKQPEKTKPEDVRTFKPPGEAAPKKK